MQVTQGNPYHYLDFGNPISTQQQLETQANSFLDYYSFTEAPGPSSPQRVQSYAHDAPPCEALTDRMHGSQNVGVSVPQSGSHGRAVCIGINYFNQKGELKRCTDGARNLCNYLQQVKHYAPASVVLLTDDQRGPFSQPTKHNILNALGWLIRDAYRGEHILIYYSGHGDSPVVRNSFIVAQDKERKMDAIYPVDFRRFKSGMLAPEEFEEFLQPLRQKGARLTIIMDTYIGVAAL